MNKLALRFAAVTALCWAWKIYDRLHSCRLGLNRSFVGHGVGRIFHASPAVLHYRNNEPDVMQVGQTFTIEPILLEDGTKSKTWADKWTVVTADGGRAAQMEHTLLITPGGVDILTLAS